jgi:3'(2'), 5'-bisphosphate nucleotidase
MISKAESYKLAALAMQAGIKASEAIMKVYNTPFAYDNKADGSPITLADRCSNDIILERLRTTGIPVVSEETQIADYSERRQWEYFWMVDPLDGTKEFISRNGEFSINIALMRANEPWLGIIVAPAEDMVWWGLAGEQAFRINSLPLQEHMNAKDLLQHSTPLLRKTASEKFAVAVSRSHMEPQTLNLIEQIERKRGPVELMERGSALKFCDLIEGRSNLYIRYSPTWEWDTAAGHALLLAHGGALFHITEHKPLAYNKTELNNPGFIAFARAEASVWYFSELSF